MWLESNKSTTTTSPTSEPEGRKLPSHQKRARLGTWAVRRDVEARKRIIGWKGDGQPTGAFLDGVAEDLVGLIRQWSPILPAGTVVTIPPQGASYPGPYAALAIGKLVAEDLDLDLVETLTRKGVKRWHGPQFSREQEPYEAAVEGDPPIVLVVDDLLTSGTTMKLSLEALNQAGFPAFGFAWSGC